MVRMTKNAVFRCKAPKNRVRMSTVWSIRNTGNAAMMLIVMSGFPVPAAKSEASATDPRVKIHSNFIRKTGCTPRQRSP